MNSKRIITNLPLCVKAEPLPAKPLEGKFPFLFFLKKIIGPSIFFPFFSCLCYNYPGGGRNNDKKYQQG